ncbi:MAG: hypothetical protein IPJ61_21050 [Tessaracoccus sp.]|uniref:hypothetical protein n=1 Tax=Tessaracoccus sp. TaxID=1971211 RepID=UPI001ECB752A|nr:hypothetical protein [Tessaracoccus sp.]MBK7823478.1 hypothetical protein [Tessaracoccus sp.]
MALAAAPRSGLGTRAAGGCHLGRPIAALVAAAGFALDDLETAYLSAPCDRRRAFNYRGAARPAEGNEAAGQRPEPAEEAGGDERVDQAVGDVLERHPHG